MPARILFVTGKGGTGKSTIATALARAAAAQGAPVLLLRCSVASRELASGAHDDAHDALHDAAAFPAPAAGDPGNGNLRERVLHGDREFAAFLHRVLPLGFVARRLLDSRTFRAVAAAAPGLRDLVLLTTIVAEASTRRGFVVVDAPATGHALPLVESPQRVLELVSSGPVAREARQAGAALRDPRRFRAVVVGIPEELPIVEAVELRDALAAAGVAAIHVVVNAVHAVAADADARAALLAAAPSTDVVRALRRAARHADAIDALEARVGPVGRVAFSPDGVPDAQDARRLLERLEEDAS